jgi:hypothetical protein
MAMSLDWNAMLITGGPLSIQVGSIVDDQWGIEGLYSQNFSVGIFFFLLFCIVVFTVIVIKFMSSGAKSEDANGQPKRLKTGEKVMFFWIFVGIVVAVIMAAMQLLQGYLF